MNGFDIHFLVGYGVKSQVIGSNSNVVGCLDFEKKIIRNFSDLGKAGTPKTIAGIHTHTTPVLLASAERAELVTDQYEIVAPTLDGICILKALPEIQT